ncbi:MAG: DUF1559 domain-containing protein, partial [Clostridia bacterium]|nr:DUF1559 domain-containing protein [Clostridia bacterium]
MDSPTLREVKALMFQPEVSMKALRLKYRFRSPFQVIFDEAQLLPEIRRSIVMMVMGNIFGNLFGVITNGSALTGYAEILGSNDFTFGVLTGIPLAASLMQIPAAILVSRTQKRKRYMMTYGVVSRALWLLVGLVPWLLPMSPDAVRLWSVIFLIGISAASGSFINVSFTPWMADLIPIRIRGRWMSLRDGMNAVGSVLIGLLTATILDNSSGYTGGLTTERHAPNAYWLSGAPGSCSSEYEVNYVLNSFHPGGIHVTLTDGAVRFVSDTVNMDTFRQLCVRD